MVRSERELLSGNVEVDETLVGGVKHEGKRGGSTAKSIVVIAVEVLKPKGFGRVRMRYCTSLMHRGGLLGAVRARCYRS